MSGSKNEEKHNDATAQTEQNLKMLFLVGVSVPAAHKLAGTSCSCHILALCFCSASFSATALRLAVSYYISIAWNDPGSKIKLEQMRQPCEVK